MGEKIYICHTYYHVLVSLVKEITLRGNSDIVICDTIPQHNLLIKKLSKCNIFDQILTFSELQHQKENAKFRIKNLIDLLLINYNYKKMLKPSFELKKKTYNEVYIFNDYTYMGYYLRANKIYYILLEDAKDSFKTLDKYVKINHTKSLKARLLSFALETTYFYGKSKYSEIIEVNDSSDLIIPANKVREKNKKEMFENLTKEQKSEIYSIFIQEKEMRISKNNKGILILTQPLFVDSIVKSIDVQRKIYKDIIDTYSKDFEITIKPHPRDNLNYEKEFKDIVIIDKNLPTEILNFNANISYKKAITVTSSSIYSIDFVEGKVYLGFEWLEKYQ